MDNSTTFGSTRINFTSSGRCLKRILEIRVLMHTLLPDPVDPATSIWGIFVKSATIGVPAISLPKATGTPPTEFLKTSVSRTSRRHTGVTFLFGTSIPTAALPGMGASIRISVAASFKARSSARCTILLTFTPAAGSNS